MHNRPTAFLGFLLLFSLTLFGCKKYEDGGYLSFSSRASRIEGNWGVAVAFDRVFLLEKTNDYAGILFQFSKDGGAGVTYPDAFGNPVVLTGTWTLEDNQETFELVLSGDLSGYLYGPTHRFDILRLTKNDFWLVDESNTEIRLVSL